jgi:hypothetical protein
VAVAFSSHVAGRRPHASCRSKAETQPTLNAALLRLSAMISGTSTADRRLLCLTKFANGA